MENSQTASMPSPLRSHLTELDTAYKGSSGQIDEVGYDLLGIRHIPSFPTMQSTDSTLSRSRSVLHARAKSLVSYMPRLGNITAPTPSTKDKGLPSSRHSPNRLFGDIFSGESAPIRLGVALQSPTKEETEFVMDYASHYTARPNSSHRRKVATIEETDSRRKSWFSRKSTASNSVQPGLADDEILKIDINSALFPHGPPDAQSPHAFNDLLLNATALVEKMQSAYREKASELASVRPEMEAQSEEVEEVETRSRHLKLQLEGMCRKAEEQDRTMKEMAEQLATEKLRFQEERERAAASIRLIRGSADESASQSIAYGVSNRPLNRRKRLSAGSHTTDSGFESNSDAMSVLSCQVREDFETSYSHPQVFYHDGSNISSGYDCSNETSAWVTAETLRHENQHLRAQLDTMQKEVQGCIDLVGMLTI